MMYLIIYMIGSFVGPIILLLADNITKGNVIGSNKELKPVAIFICSVLWPFGIAITFYCYIEYKLKY